MTYVRGVLSNNIERAQDIIWDIENKPHDFMKENSSVQGVRAVAQQIEMSLVALRSDIDNETQDSDRLRKLVQYCRMRLKRDAYRDQVDKYLADLSLLDPDPEMQGELRQSDAAGQGALK